MDGSSLAAPDQPLPSGIVEIRRSALRVLATMIREPLRAFV